MLQTIALMIYMVGGAGVYAKVEGWMFLDALFFTNYTLLTVGIGDYAPQTHVGRGLLFPYAVGGIVTLGLVVGSIRSLVLDRGKDKLGSRMMEKKRERLVQKLLARDTPQIVTPIETRKQSRQAQMTERERRKQEFQLLRSIQRATENRQKWIGLAMSGGAWFILWFIGALVFYLAEHEQGWTYFQSLYFAYTSLLTIGYGDFKPFSNSGKAFFVFWSLLAVPTLTIVISNMGDTVVKAIKDATLYLGEVTVLPGDTSAKERLKEAARKLSRDKFSKDAPGVYEQEPPGLLGKGSRLGRVQPNENVRRGADTMTGQVEQSEMQAERSDQQKNNVLGSSIHDYHAILAREFRIVLEHLSETPPKRYTYEEWAYYLDLIGEDESSTKSHGQPSVRPDKLGESTETRKVSDETDNLGLKEWSWLGEQSPLMGGMEEAEWVLDKLARRLEDSLKNLRDQESRKSGQGHE